jgi:hypothetical protein
MFARLHRVVDHFIYGLSPQDWLLVLLGVALWGLFCMRGFGQRT